MSNVSGPFKKYREVILYLFFGGCTTVLNIIAYYTLTRFLFMGTNPATVFAWMLSVLFAYATNHYWVFQSTKKSLNGIIREMINFFGARLATGVMDLSIMYLSVDVFRWNDLLIKIVSNILVIMVNYILSKLYIFKKK